MSRKFIAAARSIKSVSDFFQPKKLLLNGLQAMRNLVQVAKDKHVHLIDNKLAKYVIS